MAERTADEVASIFANAGDSVTLINGNKQTGQSDAEWKDDLQRNVDHLEVIKAYKKEDGTTSIWTSENFTAVNAAITSGKSKIAAL
jgi:pyruvate/2-oxoglutarate dehydrogenase complex dihydrolipoamide dehydrogenase (E3) component